MKQQSYWLMDGKNKTAVFPRSLFGNVFEFPDLIIKSFDMLGDYECVIENEFIRGGRIVSKKILLLELQGALSYDRAMKYLIWIS